MENLNNTNKYEDILLKARDYLNKILKKTKTKFLAINLFTITTS